MDTPHLSVVIPAFNESARLVDTLTRCTARLQGCVPSWEIIVVDDGSEDDTREIVAGVSARDARVRLIAAPHGGKGAAVRRGMLAARGAWCFFADADLSMDLDQLPAFFAAQADVAIASREAPGAKRIGEPWSRHVIGRAFNMVVRLLAVPGIQDTQCGYKLFSARAVQLLFPAARLDGFAFDVELLYVATRFGLRVAEVPVTWRNSPDSRVSMTKAPPRMLIDVLRVLWRFRRGGYNP